jgi:hypothetical protein
MATPTTYGLGFLRANTFWKDIGVYFHMNQISSPYHVGAGHNHHVSVENFFYQRCCNTLFWPIGPCIMLSPIRTRPSVRGRPSLPEVVLPHLLNLVAMIRNTRVLLIEFNFLLRRSAMRCWLDSPSPISRTTTLLCFS